MWALVEDGSITKLINNPRGMIIGDIQYSRNIFSFRWTNEEREAIGLYEVEFDNTNKKDETYYINADVSYAFGSGKVTGSYGTATAKSINDVLFTAEDEAAGKGTEGEVKTKGLKTLKKEDVKKQAARILAETDWYILRKADANTAVPSAITTHRAAVRTKSGQMETAINNASDVDALVALYVYNNDDPPTRPLGDLPTLEV